MDNLLLNCQIAVALLLKQIATILSVSQDSLAYALAESLGKSDKTDTVKGYFRKVPQKFLISSFGYKKFRKGLEQGVAKLCTPGFVCDVDMESVRNSWAQNGEELLNQLDRILRKGGGYLRQGHCREQSAEN